MYSIEDFAQFSKSQALDALKEMGVPVPTGQHSKLDLCNLMLAKQKLGKLTCKIKGVELTAALENSLLLLDGAPYPAKPEVAAPAPVYAAPAPVPAPAPDSSKISGDAEEAATIRRLIMAGATKAIKFTSANNQRERVPLSVRGRRITYTIGHTLPILDNYLEVAKSTSYSKTRFSMEEGKPRKKVETIHRFHYQVDDILRTEELKAYWPLVEQTQARLKAERERKAKVA